MSDDTTTQEPGPAPAPELGDQDKSSDAQYAVYDTTIGQYVSGVMSKRDAGKAKTELGKTGRTQGHDLETRKVN